MKGRACRGCAGSHLNREEAWLRWLLPFRRGGGGAGAVSPILISREQKDAAAADISVPVHIHVPALTSATSCSADRSLLENWSQGQA